MKQVFKLFVVIYICGKNAEEIYGVPKSDIKKNLNLILAINKSEILLEHYYKNETIGTQEFIMFIEEFIKKIGKEKFNKHIFILDNVSYHI